MAQIMLLLNENGLLKPGSHVYKTVRKMVSDKIDRLGPDAALADVVDRKLQILNQIKVLAMWHKSTGRLPPAKL